jgi:hypothetical protein
MILYVYIGIFKNASNFIFYMELIFYLYQTFI